jgi:protein-S-isoprenylcysteine O-methyltransferase Ste14
VRPFHYFALFVFFLDLPVPLYWFILHPFAKFWYTHIRAAFYIAGLGAWTAGAVFVLFFRNYFLAAGSPSLPITMLGLALVAADAILIYRAGKDLGRLKLVGHAELTGNTVLVTNGIYRHIRHPRYIGMIAAIAGACLLAGSRWALIVSAIWLVIVLAVIFLEEHEMRARFGSVYDDYCRVVPRFLPRF